MRPNELWICPDTEPSGVCPLLSMALGVGLFEEEKEKISVASDIHKVKGGNLDNPGCPRGDRGMSAVFNRKCVPLGSPVMKP